MKVFLRLLIPLILLCSSVSADILNKVPEITIPAAADWNDLEHMAGMDGVHCLGKSKLLSQKIKFYIGTNGKSLFLVSEADTAPSGILQRGRTASMVLNDDTYEFWIFPHREL